MALMPCEDIRTKILCQLQQWAPRTLIQVYPTNEVANPIMTQLLATLLVETLVNWTLYIYLLMLDYNISFHPANQQPPFARILRTTPHAPSFYNKHTPYS